MGVTIVGLTEVLRMLDNLMYLLNGSADQLNAIAKQIKEDLAQYPAPKSYPRTGQLGAGWTVEPASVSPKQYLQDIFNEVEYAAMVQRSGSQAWFHEGYWQTDEEIAKKYENELESVLTREIERIFSS